MLLGILKETLIFQHQNDSLFYRYEIFKNEHRGGYFSIVYFSHNCASQNITSPEWKKAIPFLMLKSNYLPNARIECELHFNEMDKAAALQ